MTMGAYSEKENEAMWYVTKTIVFDEKHEALSRAVIFDEEALQDYLDEGWKVMGKWQISLLEGDDFLPSAIVEE